MTITGLDRLLEDASAWTKELKHGRAAFIGCGDSLAASRPAEMSGHRVMSAGDIAWTQRAPRGVDVSIALSWSGRTGATIKAAEVVKGSGQPLWAITSNRDSPLAALADHHLELPGEERHEAIPSWGFALHSTAVLGVLGTSVSLPRVLEAANRLEKSPLGAALPGAAPHAMTVAALPDSFAAAEFWSLKLIEATGVAVRVVPLEEIGHVDYFIGPQPHLVVIPLVCAGRERAERLGDALRANGHIVVMLDLVEAEPNLSDDERRLALSLVGASVAGKTAHAWARPPFRGGAVDMSAQHIQV